MLSQIFKRSFAKSEVETFRPLWDYCLIQRFTTPETTVDGIYIPDSIKGRHNEGQVVAVGPGKRDEHGNYIPMTLKRGDRVYLQDWTHGDVKLDGKEYIVIREEDVLGKVV
ncbi:hypothetical protein M9Y10_042469 [Tritrichomonas musculus]|uniref:10 kDa chaperonin n=1 Tax=Tritrichomonas musculus TaxID=1915356 RepID=A0ABR2GNR4_9EUKA